MAISRVQFKTAAFGGSVGGDPCDAVFDANVTQGNLLVVFTRDFEGGPVSVTTGLANTTFTRHTGNEAGTEPRMTVWSAIAGATGACTVSATWGAAQTYRWCFAGEYSAGADTWSATAATRLQTSGTTIGSGTTDMVSSAITTSKAGLLLMAVSENGLVTYTAGTDFSLVVGNIGLSTPVDERFGGVEQYIHSAPLASYTAHVTSAGSNAYRTIWADFKVETATIAWMPVRQVARGAMSRPVPTGILPPGA